MTRRITTDMARWAEALGFDSLTVWDHLLSAPGVYGGSWLDPLMVLARAAGATETIPLARISWWCPSGIRVISKRAGDIGLHVRGDFFLGVGPGWNEPEFTSMGISMRERGRRTDEILMPSNCS